MTTVFGIKHPEVEEAIIVADRQTTSVSEQTGIPSGKFLGRKLWKSKDDNFCFGHAGNRDQETYDFIQKFIVGEFDIEGITKKGYFPELRKLNLGRMGRQHPDMQKLSGIVLTTRFEKNPKLWTCFPLGEVGERIWTSVGSGDEKIIQYMDALKTLNEARDYQNPDTKARLQDILRVGLEAVRRSQSQDLYSHGLDLMVCTPEGINDHYTELGDDFGKKLRRISKRYK